MLPSLRRQGKDEVFLWLILCDLFQPFCDMTEVSPRFLHFSGIAKKSRRADFPFNSRTNQAAETVCCCLSEH